METKKLITYLQAVITIACLTFSGCGGELWTNHPDRELKPGPGVFSGKDGEFTLIRSSEKKGTNEGQTGKETL